MEDQENCPLFQPIIQEDEMVFIDSQKASKSSFGEIENDLSTSMADGLKTIEAVHRQKLYGLNDFDVGVDTPLWQKYLNQV